MGLYSPECRFNHSFLDLSLSLLLQRYEIPMIIRLFSISVHVRLAAHIALTASSHPCSFQLASPISTLYTLYTITGARISTWCFQRTFSHNIFLSFSRARARHVVGGATNSTTLQLPAVEFTALVFRFKRLTLAWQLVRTLTLRFSYLYVRLA